MTTRRRLIGSALAGTLAVTGVGAMTALPAAAATGCEVYYSTTAQWPGGFTANVTVRNLGDALDGWDLAWTFPAGQQIGQIWNGTVQSSSGGAVVVGSVDHNRTVASGGEISFGFLGSWEGSNPEPTSFTLDGVTCSGDVVPDPGPDPDPQPDPDPEPDPDPDPDPQPDPDPDPDPDPQPSGGLYVDPTTQAYEAWSAATGTDKALLEKIALTPQAYWVGDWTSASGAAEAARDYTSRAQQAGATGTLVIYAIPGRDCGQHSGGGVETSEYARWIDTVAGGIVGNPIVVLEPDALPMLGDCDGQGDRVGYLRYAAQKLTEAGGRVYIDIGHSGWLSADEAARRLNQVGFQHAVGFSVNVSNYQTTADSRAWAEQVSQATGGKGYVIDTSRNGNGSNGEWCNPRGRALGERPRLVNDSTGLDALLWIKLPGESDGSCNGGPPAGQWFQEIALELARNAAW